MLISISRKNWNNLTQANDRAVAQGWAMPGVFATGIGPDYQPGGEDSILYVGKSAGPLGGRVGSSNQFASSSEASTQWMIDRVNKSAFWQMIDKVDRTRRTIAWTNICKMDRVGGVRPPNGREWQTIRDACLAALLDEISVLRPRTAFFATSDYVREDVVDILAEAGYTTTLPSPDSQWTTVLGRTDGAKAVITRHPQGWGTPHRDKVLDFVRKR